MIFGPISTFCIITLGRLYQIFASLDAIRFGDLYELYHWLGFYVLIDILFTIERLLWHILHFIPFYMDLRVLIFVWVLIAGRKITKISYYPIIEPWISQLLGLSNEDVENVKIKLNSCRICCKEFFSFHGN